MIVCINPRRLPSPYTIAILCFLLFVPYPVFGQDRPIIIASSPSPVGSGARAAGLGGAFIAVADDATAASWNPAGLVQLERLEISVVGSFYHQREKIGSDWEIENVNVSEGTNRSGNADLNYLGAVYPFEAWNRNVVISLSYQKKLDFHKRANLSTRQDFGANGGAPITLLNHVEFEQSGGLVTVSPALAIQIVPNLSLGVALNCWTREIYNGSSWEVYTHLRGLEVKGGEVNREYESVEEVKFLGFTGTNATFGLLWTNFKGLSIGTFYELGFKARVGQDHTFISKSGAHDRIYNFQYNLKIDMPPSYGLGFSYRFNDRLMISTDVTRVEWSEFVLTDEMGRKTNLMGTDHGDGDPETTHTVRLGAEYLWFLERFLLATRAGAFYDPQPSSGAPKDYYGFSLGAGIILKNFHVDWAYQLRVGTGDEGTNLLDIMGEDVLQGASLDSYQHLFLLSIVYWFGK